MPENIPTGEKEAGEERTYEEAILHAFLLNQTTVLSLDELLRATTDAGCPSPNIAREVISTMIREGILKKYEKDGVLLFLFEAPAPEEKN